MKSRGQTVTRVLAEKLNGSRWHPVLPALHIRSSQGLQPDGAAVLIDKLDLKRRTAAVYLDNRPLLSAHQTRAGAVMPQGHNFKKLGHSALHDSEGRM